MVFSREIVTYSFARFVIQLTSYVNRSRHILNGESTAKISPRDFISNSRRLILIISRDGQHSVLNVLIFIHFSLVQMFVKVGRIVVFIGDANPDVLGHAVRLASRVRARRGRAVPRFHF